MSKRRNVEPVFVPKVIEENSDDQPRFLAFVPNQIEARDKYDPQLIGFPLNIVFAGTTDDAQAGQQSVVSVCY